MDLIKKSTSHAERQRRYRERQNRDRAVISVEVDLFEVVYLLVETGRLDADAGRNESAIAAALSALIDEWKVQKRKSLFENT